jgi:hypothetical protein
MIMYCLTTDDGMNLRCDVRTWLGTGIGAVTNKPPCDVPARGYTTQCKAKADQER